MTFPSTSIQPTIYSREHIPSEHKVIYSTKSLSNFPFCRIKAGGNPTESALIAQLEQGLALEFERSDAARKLRLLLSELLFVTSQVSSSLMLHFIQSFNDHVLCNDPRTLRCVKYDWLKQSEYLFHNMRATS